MNGNDQPSQSDSNESQEPKDQHQDKAYDLSGYGNTFLADDAPEEEQQRDVSL